MSPPAWAPSKPTAGFPRTRGDETTLVPPDINDLGFSPHARG